MFWKDLCIANTSDEETGRRGGVIASSSDEETRMFYKDLAI